MNPKDFYTTHLVRFDMSKESRGNITVNVLEFLIGRKWDEIALAYVSALDPYAIRVTYGEMTCDSINNRVTVIVNENDIIKEIFKEVDVYLPDKVVHGAALKNALHFGIDSPQCQFYNNEDIWGYFYHNNNLYACTHGDDTPPIPYPEPEFNYQI